MDYLYYLAGTLIFIAVVLLFEGVYLGWNSTRGPEAARVARRLRLMTSGGPGAQAVSITKDRPLSKNAELDLLLRQLPRADALDRLLMQSGRSWNVAQFCGTALLLALIAFALASYFGLPMLLRLALGAAAAVLPLMDASRSKASRLTRIEEQLPDALDLMGRALRAGHALPTALKMVADEMNDPLASEFRIVFDEVNFGVSMSDALVNLATRVPSTDLRYFVVAVLIQRETGGNLSELLGSISAIIRDRLKLLGQVRVLAAEGKMSAWVLSLLPFGAALLIQLTNPKFLELLYTDPSGRKMIAAAGVMMLMGIIVMRNVIRIRV